MPRQIGTLAEKSLHAAIKAHYAQPGDQLEADLGGYVIDILRPDECVEIQTRHFGSLKPKLDALLDDHRFRVVYPVAQEHYIVRIDANGEIAPRRKSPKRGTVYSLFNELMRLPKRVLHPNFTLDVLLIHDLEVWLEDGQGSWRRKHWSIQDRTLLKIVRAASFNSVADYAALLPPNLSPIFDTADLAQGIHQQRPLAQKMAYCLREMGVIELAGKRGNSLLYQVRP